MVVLVVGATGELGSATVRALLRDGHRVRAFVRPDAAHAHLAGPQVDLVFGDLRAPATVDAALQGVDAVVATANSVVPRGRYRFEAVEGEGYRHLIAASRRAGVSRFALASVPPTPFDALAPAFALKHAAEAQLRESGLTHTILQPSLFMDGWLALVGCRTAGLGAEAPTLSRPFWFSRAFLAVVGGSVERHGLAFIPGDGRAQHAFVAVRDVATFLSRALTADAARDATWQIGGPDTLDWFAVAELIGRVLGRRVRTVHTPDAVFRLQSALLRPFSPAAANLMTLNRIAGSVATPFESRARAAELGFALTGVEAFLREKRALALPAPVA